MKPNTQVQESEQVHGLTYKRLEAERIEKQRLNEAVASAHVRNLFSFLYCWQLLILKFSQNTRGRLLIYSRTSASILCARLGIPRPQLLIWMTKKAILSRAPLRFCSAKTANLNKACFRVSCQARVNMRVFHVSFQRYV